MRLQHITFTGIDGKTDLRAIMDIRKKYPIAEFGVLVSKNWYKNGNRYFNPSYIDGLYRGFRFSAHLCGSIARAAVRGDLEPFLSWAGFYSLRDKDEMFGRCQLNIAPYSDNPETVNLTGDILLFDEIILQQKSADDCSLYLNSKENGCISVLLDASGGEGIDTPIKILEGRKVGYAGGISPDNVAEKLTYLYEHTEGDFWIDMESGVRTDDWFDLDKVVKVLEICQPIIDRYEKE